jgi:hypothetical protein
MKKEIKKEDYYECKRCDINSLGLRMCPCPRGGCEAEVVGEKITTVQVVITKAKK